MRLRPIVLAGALACATAFAVAAGCARHRAPPAYPFSVAAPQVFVATPDGLVPLAPGAAPDSLAHLEGPAALVPSASVLSSNGSAILVAENRVGPWLLEPDPGCRAYRLRGSALPDPFALLTVGGAWPRRGGFLVQLFRDPFSNPDSPASVRLGTLVSVDGQGSPTVLGGSALVTGVATGFGLFALYPVPEGGWLAELRRDEPDRVTSRYLALENPEDAAAREVPRSVFESALSPRALALVGGAKGEALRHALAVLAASDGASAEGLLIRARGADGSDQFFSDGTPSDDGRTLNAWYFDDGRVMVLEPEGGAAISDSRGASLSLRFIPPVPGALFTSLASCRRLVAVAWEAGSFPDIGAAGLIVRAIP